jgi:short-subunit dehydrogenase
MDQLREGVAIVTGASRGIGVAIAEALAGEGMQVSISARSSSELDTVRRRLEARGARAIATVGDISDADHRRELVDRTLAEFGPIDLLVNNAGIEDTRHYHTSDPDVIERLISVNLLAAMQLTRQVLPQMLERRRGHIVNIASAAGKIGPPFMASYAASKHGLVGFTQALASEYRRSGVGFTAVCPGLVTDIGMYARWEDRGAKSPKLAGTCKPEAVVKATLQAIRKNRPEVTINTPPVRPSIVLGNIAPRLVPRLFELIGYTKTLERVADLNERG